MRKNKKRYYLFITLILVLFLAFELFIIHISSEKSVFEPYTEIKKNKLYLVIDDAGYSLEKLEKLLKLNIKMTVAVLPGLEHSAASYKLLKIYNTEAILHQPMESVGGQNPGPGAIFAEHSFEDIVNILEKNIMEAGQPAGMNNHMGSLITADEKIMMNIMTVLKNHDMYFLDSMTTSFSAGSRVAEKLNIKFAHRNVFLDNKDERDYIMNAFNESLELARKQGYAVMIGHVWSNELADVILDLLPHIDEEDFEFEFLSRIFTEN
jgi:hypothetical protein